MKRIIVCMHLIVLLVVQGRSQPNRIQRLIEATEQKSFSSVPLFSSKSTGSERAATLNQYIKSYGLLNVNSSALTQVASNNLSGLEIDVPMEGAVVTLQLIKNKAAYAAAVYTTQNGSGKQVFSYTPGAYYTGIIKGQPSSLVAISFFSNSIIGVITNDKGNYVLGNSNTLDRSSTEYILYNENDLLIDNRSGCGAMTPPSGIPSIPGGREIQVANKCVKVYIETDYAVYQAQGNNTTNVLNFVTGLFNVTTTLYQNESIATTISQVNVWTSTDPYASATNTGNALTLFGTQMSSGFNGDLAHLFSSRNLGGGIAWVNTLCSSSTQYKTAVSANLSTSTPGFPTYSWNAMVVTHEMGHNLGSLHTHDCVWNGNNTAIDGCSTPSPCANPGIPAGGGTIMSYCHLQSVGINFNLGFGPQPGNLIRNNVANATCLGYCCPSNIVITGNYSTAVTESQTWIQSSGQTTIVSTANVKLDADPVNGYVLFAPASGSDFFSSTPTGSGVLVVQALDGCGPSLPLIPNNTDNTTLISSIYDQTTISVYPNPSNGIFNIESALDQSYTIRVVNLLGQMVYSGTYKSQLNLMHLNRGIYILQISSKEGKQVSNTKISID